MIIVFARLTGFLADAGWSGHRASGAGWSLFIFFKLALQLRLLRQRRAFALVQRIVQPRAVILVVGGLGRRAEEVVVDHGHRGAGHRADQEIGCFAHECFPPLVALTFHHYNGGRGEKKTPASKLRPSRAVVEKLSKKQFWPFPVLLAGRVDLC